MRCARIIVAIVAPTVAYADPVATSGETTPRRPPGEVSPTPAPDPPYRELDTAGVAGKPQPGNESGRIDDADRNDSAFRLVARGALFLPKLALEVALSPLRGAVWAEDRYKFENAAKR